jgi:hypothetical protein
MFQHNFSLHPCLQPLHPVRLAYPPPRTSSPVGSCGIRACGRGVFGEGERDCLECQRERDAASRCPYRDWDDSKTARGKVEWGVSRRRSTGACSPPPVIGFARKCVCALSGRRRGGACCRRYFTAAQLHRRYPAQVSPWLACSAALLRCDPPPPSV